MIFESDDLDSPQPANDIEAAVGRIMSAADRYERSSALGPVQRWNELAAIIRAELGRVPAQQTGAAEELLTEIRTALNASGGWHLGMNTVDVIKSLIASRVVAQQVEVPAVEPVTDEQILTAWRGFTLWGFETDEDRIERARDILALQSHAAKGVKS